MLASADPAAKPIIDPRYFADEADLDVLVAGVGMARDIAAHEPLAGITAGEIMPGPEINDDEQIREWVRGSRAPCFTRPGPAPWAAARRPCAILSYASAG
jgi:choline dehydrogenase